MLPLALHLQQLQLGRNGPVAIGNAATRRLGRLEQHARPLPGRLAQTSVEHLLGCLVRRAHRHVQLQALLLLAALDKERVVVAAVVERARTSTKLALLAAAAA